MKMLFCILLSSLVCSQPLLAENQKNYTKNKAPNSNRVMLDKKYDDNSGFFLEYMILRSYNSGLAYAFERKIDQTPGALSNQIVATNMINPNQTWRPGFRIGYQQDVMDGWAIQTNWTYYYNKSVTNKAMPDIALDTNNQNTTEGYIPFFAYPRTDTTSGASDHVVCQNIHGVWQLNYNLLNLEFSHEIYKKERLNVRGHFGLQNGWIHQKMNVLYGRYLVDRTPDSEIFRDQLVQAHNNFWGIGFTGGFDGEINLGQGFQILAKTNLSLLSGRTNVRDVQSHDFGGGGGFRRFLNWKDRTLHYAPGIQTAIGLGWFYEVMNAGRISIVANWESNFWWAQLGYLQVTPAQHSGGGSIRDFFEYYPSNNGPLYLEGVTVRGSYEF